MRKNKPEYDRLYYEKNRERYNERSKKYHAENRDVINKRKREYYAQNIEQMREKTRKYIELNKEKHLNSVKNAHLKRTYGIGVDKYNQMLSEQGDLCAICKKKETHIKNNKVRRLSVDHDHNTGRVRGLLCIKCNFLIGYLNEDVRLLPLIKQYLENRI